MRIDTKKYLSILANEHKGEFFCQYCGVRIASYSSNEGFCTVCEMQTSMTEPEAKENADLYELASKKNEAIRAGDYETAAQYVDKISEAGKPFSAYSGGMFYYFYSHILYSSTDYNGRGFMDENSDKKDMSMLTYSKFKRLMFETISYCESGLKQSQGIKLAYLKLLAESKLKRQRQGLKTIAMINSIGRDTPIADYANMVYSSTLTSKADENAIGYINKVFSRGHTNSLYYLAYVLYRRGDIKNAKVIADATKSLLPLSGILLYKIKSVETAMASP